MVVIDTAGDTETDSVLKGVVRSERLQCPADYIDVIWNAVEHEHIAAISSCQIRRRYVVDMTRIVGECFAEMWSIAQRR